ncbi:E3 ubiquitin-protein ligase AIRP2-like isoform X4 [Diospyros lotus]|uniref:E3 ubiquitin-protein ligase AIRP2-like isoform X4 n=1 Tax=Diospyros lotus TaxID=55363 RepID=UPI00224DDA8E|nr:E3 ubiquitin-protein ligase AIRP2-like isoform X4 [Diospyros lotus]
MVDYYQVAARRASYPDSIQILEADIQHANTLAASIPRAKDGTFLQMKLLYNPSVHVLRFLLQWMDLSCSCLLPSYLNLFYVVVYKVSPDWKPIISSHARKATIREFYTLVLPSLQRLSNNIADVNQDDDLMTTARTSSEEKRDLDFDRDEECGICLEPCTQMVLPNCCHAMCINCYRDWKMRSESCPFCRGSLRRVSSGDLWVLMSSRDAVDPETASREEILQFYLYINSLPKDTPDAVFLMYYEYLI